MNEQRKRKIYRKSQRDEVTSEEASHTLRLTPPPVLDRELLETHLENSFETRAGRSALANIAEITNHPGRVIVLWQAGNEITRPMIIVDKACREFISSKVRVKQFNAMSAAGVEFVKIDLIAEQWAETLLSGRRLRSDGSIS